MDRHGRSRGSDERRISLSRRTYLATVGSAASGVLAGCNEILPFDSGSPEKSSPTRIPSDGQRDTGAGSTTRSSTERQGDTQSKTPEIERHGIAFDRTVDIVEHLGADPNGGEPVADVLEAGTSEGTLVQFPPGRYLVTRPIQITADRVGLLATEDVRFVVQSGYHNAAVWVDGPDEFLFEGIDIAHRGRSSPHLRLHSPTKFHVQDVRFVGRGANRGYAFNIALQDESGEGTLRNVRVPHGSDPSVYGSGNGRIGLWAGFRHKRTLRFENSELSEFGNNGIYSRCPGNIQVVDSYFSNNNVAGVRIAGRGSFVENTTIVVDFSEYNGPFESPNGSFGPAGVVFDNKKPDMSTEEFPPKKYPGEVRGSTIELRNVPETVTENRGAAACIDIWGTTRAVRISNCDLLVDIDEVQAIVREFPHGRGNYRSNMSKPPAPHFVELDNVRVDGSASGREAVLIDGAARTKFSNCTIRQTGADRNGIDVVNSPGTTIRGGEIVSSSYPIVLEDWVRPGGGACPLLVEDAPTLESTQLDDLGQTTSFENSLVGREADEGLCGQSIHSEDDPIPIGIINITGNSVRVVTIPSTSQNPATTTNQTSPTGRSSLLRSTLLQEE